MTLRVSNWQSESDLNSIRNSCNVFLQPPEIQDLNNLRRYRLNRRREAGWCCSNDQSALLCRALLSWHGRDGVWQNLNCLFQLGCLGKKTCWAFVIHSTSPPRRRRRNVVYSWGWHGPRFLRSHTAQRQFHICLIFKSKHSCFQTFLHPCWTLMFLGKEDFLGGVTGEETVGQWISTYVTKGASGAAVITLSPGPRSQTWIFKSLLAKIHVWFCSLIMIF